MTRSSTSTFGRVVWHAALAALVLALGLTCAALAAAVSSSAMGAMGEGSAAAPVVPSVAVTTAREVAAPAAAAPQPMPSPCADMCAGLTAGDMCTAAAGFALIGALALLLADPRNPFLGLLARERRPGPSRRRLRERTPWLALSPVSLCVFRV